MGTVIDELIVSLALDGTKFNKGQKEAVDSLKKLEDQAKRGGANIEKSAGSVEQSFAVLQKRLLGIGALLFGGLSIDKFIEKMTRLNVATANLSANIGVSSQALQAWANVGERFGVSGGAVQQTFQSLAQQAAAYRNNRANLPQLFQFQQGANSAVGKIRGAQGVQLFGQNGDMLPPEEVLTRLNKWLGNETKAGRGVDARQALRQYGGLNDDTITLLGKSAKELSAALEQAKKLAPNDEQVKRFEELNKATETAKQSLEALGRDLTDTVLPQLTEFANFISKIVGFWRGDPAVKKQVDKEGDALHDDLRRRFGAPPAALEDWAKGLSDNTKAVKSLKDALEGLLQRKGGYGYFDPTGNTGGADFGSGARLINAMYSGGGAAGGAGIGGGFGAGGAGARDGGGGAGTANADVGALAGNPYISSRRAALLAQIDKNPQMKRDFFKAMALEEGRGMPRVAAMETMLNRMLMTNSTDINKELHSGFYGPVNRGGLRGGLSEADRRAGEEALEAVRRGSNITLMRSDQGMLSDPNGRGPGRVKVPGTTGVFNFWKGKRGGHYYSHEDAARFADEENRRAQDSMKNAVPLPRPHPLGSSESSLNLLGASRLAAYMPGHDGGISSSTSMSIGNIHIHTAATDGPGIASTIGPAIKRFASISSANNGPT